VFEAPVLRNRKKNRHIKSVSTIIAAFKTLTSKSKRIADALADSDMFLRALGKLYPLLSNFNIVKKINETLTKEFATLKLFIFHKILTYFNRFFYENNHKNS